MKEILEKAKGYLLIGYDWLNKYWNLLFTSIFKMEKPLFALKYALIGLVALIVLIIIIGACAKKTKIIFHYGKNKEKVKCKYKKPINFPKLNPKGAVLEGWYKDAKYKTKYDSEILVTRKKKLHLYAKFVKETVAVETPIIEPVQTVAQPAPIETPITVESVVAPVTTVETGVVEEIINDIPSIMTLGDIYDELRYALLSYERAKAFTKIGVIRKQFIAEMFEKDGKIYLYLAIDPEMMQLKGYNVEKFSEREFAVVPCKKVIVDEEGYLEALKLIEETMLFNNLVKAQTVFAKKVVSDEQARRSGFAFFIKNEVIATSAEEYYKLLRASTNCYSVSPLAKNLKQVSNKMILKIFKKEDLVYLYLALDAEKEGLEFVGYDRNFVDTPSMFVVKTAEDFNKANVLIDKLMRNFEMEKHPDKAELLLDEVLQKNCGFGYRIRF